MSEDGDLKYISMWTRPEDEFKGVLVTREPKEKVNEAVETAVEEVKEENPNYSVDDVVEKVEEKIELIDVEHLAVLQI